MNNSQQHQKPKLLDQVRHVIRRKGYSYKTEKSYVGWIKRYILYHNKRHPKDMGPQEIEQFLTHLAVDLSTGPSRSQAFTNTSPRILSVIPSPRICWKTDTISVPSKSCWATRT